MTIFEIKGLDIAFHYVNDFGKYLNTGDYVILDNHYYRIFSKTYDTFEDKWILVVEATHLTKKED